MQRAALPYLSLALGVFSLLSAGRITPRVQSAANAPAPTAAPIVAPSTTSTAATTAEPTAAPTVALVGEPTTRHDDVSAGAIAGPAVVAPPPATTIVDDRTEAKQRL